MKLVCRLSLARLVSKLVYSKLEARKVIYSRQNTFILISIFELQASILSEAKSVGRASSPLKELRTSNFTKPNVVFLSILGAIPFALPYL